MNPAIFKTIAEGDDFQAALASAVRIVHYRYGRYVDRDELVQEGWLWAYEREKRLREIADRSRTANRERMFRNALANYLSDWCKREVTQRTGYTPRPDDQVPYSIPMLRELMPDVYDHERSVSGMRLDEVVTGGADPAEGGNHMTAVADVANALGRLSPADQKILFLRFGAGDSNESIALGLGVEPATVDVKVHRALGRLRKELGPPPDVEDQEYIGTRRVMSNATAQAITGEYQ